MLFISKQHLLLVFIPPTPLNNILKKTSLDESSFLIFHFDGRPINLYRSDGRVIWNVCFWIGRLGLDSESGQTNDFKNCYSQLPCLTFSIKGTVWRTSRQVYLLCRWERHLTGFPHLSVVDRWLATPKRARTALRRFLVIGG